METHLHDSSLVVSVDVLFVSAKIWCWPKLWPGSWLFAFSALFTSSWVLEKVAEVWRLGKCLSDNDLANNKSLGLNKEWPAAWRQVFPLLHKIKNLLYHLVADISLFYTYESLSICPLESTAVFFHSDIGPHSFRHTYNCSRESYSTHTVFAINASLF